MTTIRWTPPPGTGEWPPDTTEFCCAAPGPAAAEGCLASAATMPRWRCSPRANGNPARREQLQQSDRRKRWVDRRQIVGESADLHDRRRVGAVAVSEQRGRGGIAGQALDHVESECVAVADDLLRIDRVRGAKPTQVTADTRCSNTPSNRSWVTIAYEFGHPAHPVGPHQAQGLDGLRDRWHRHANCPHQMPASVK